MSAPLKGSICLPPAASRVSASLTRNAPFSFAGCAWPFEKVAYAAEETVHISQRQSVLHSLNSAVAKMEVVHPPASPSSIKWVRIVVKPWPGTKVRTLRQTIA